MDTDKKQKPESAANAAAVSTEVILPGMELNLSYKPEVIKLDEQRLPGSSRWNVPFRQYKLHGKDVSIPDFVIWQAWVDGLIGQIAVNMSKQPGYEDKSVSVIREKVEFFIGRRYCKREHVGVPRNVKK